MVFFLTLSIEKWKIRKHENIQQMQQSALKILKVWKKISKADKLSKSMCWNYKKTWLCQQANEREWENMQMLISFPFKEMRMKKKRSFSGIG